MLCQVKFVSGLTAYKVASTVLHGPEIHLISPKAQ